MPALAACPTAPHLQRFLLGQVPPHDAETLERHVEQCVPCQRSLETLDLADGLVEAARVVAARPALDARGPIANLMDHLARLPSLGTDAAQTTGNASPSPTPWLDVQALLAPAQSPDELGRLGTYRVLSVIGSGGMGVVFRAEDTQLGRLVALKVIRPHLAANATARQRFLREARTAAAVEHDHIVPLYHVGEDHGVPFLAFQLLEGESLDSRLKREETLPVAEAIRIAREAALGLTAAHERGLIHRDIKPSNIWLETQGHTARVRLLDFGLARTLTDDPSLTDSGTVVGTPAFMSPEQARAGPVDPRSDLFSLGCVLYRMCTGELPFPGATSMAVLLALAQDHPPAPHLVNSAVPIGLSEYILRLLAKTPAHRPASARDVAETLASVPRLARRRLVTRRRVLTLVTALGLPALAGLVYFRLPGGEDAATRAEREKFQGAWYCVRMESDGRLMPVEFVRSIRWTVAGDQADYRDSNWEAVGTLTFHVGTDPKRYVFRGADGVSHRFIYYFADDDNLVYCGNLAVADDWPRQFQTGVLEGGGSALLHMRRVKEYPRPRANGRLLFQDRFDTAKPLLDPLIHPKMLSFEQANGYGRMTTTYYGVSGAVYGKQRFGDFAAEYEFRGPDPPPDCSYGICFRGDVAPTGGLPSFYVVLIHPREEKVLTKCWQLAWTLRREYALERGVLDPTGLNRVRIEVQGPEFRVFVNGTFAARVIADKLPGPGVIGLFVRGSKGESNTVFYSNLRIHELPVE